MNAIKLSLCLLATSCAGITEASETGLVGMASSLAPMVTWLLVGCLLGIPLFTPPVRSERGTAWVEELRRFAGWIGRSEEAADVERVVTVLFADIRDFTTRCESLAPVDAVRFLNLYHERMTSVIEANGGIVNQLVGDGIMAIFGATGQSRHADEAIAAGRAMLDSLDELGETLESHGFGPVRIGVGVNTGPAVVGTIGSPRRMEYTAIGDTVNTAARIESLTKELGHSLLVSAATWTAAERKPEGRALAPVSIRGRRAEMTLYAVAV